MIPSYVHIWLILLDSLKGYGLMFADKLFSAVWNMYYFSRMLPYRLGGHDD